MRFDGKRMSSSRASRAARCRLNRRLKVIARSFALPFALFRHGAVLDADCGSWEVLAMPSDRGSSLSELEDDDEGIEV